MEILQFVVFQGNQTIRISIQLPTSQSCPIYHKPINLNNQITTINSLRVLYFSKSLLISKQFII